MTKENPCNKCCSYKQNKVCECNELFAYRHYLQGREDGIDEIENKVLEWDMNSNDGWIPCGQVTNWLEQLKEQTK